MTVYEKRTYSIMVGRMPDVFQLYENEGWPALKAGGFDEKLIGYFISDTGPLHQLIHLWRFDDDDDRRDFWKRLFGDDDFKAFVTQLRPLIQTQEIQLLFSAPWGPKP